MLDPHLPLIEGWLAAEPHLTAIAILSRLGERYPGQFGKPQHSIVQRLLKASRAKAARQLIADTEPTMSLAADRSGHISSYQFAPSATPEPSSGRMV
jgi:hypothetical protein